MRHAALHIPLQGQPDFVALLSRGMVRENEWEGRSAVALADVKLLVAAVVYGAEWWMRGDHGPDFSASVGGEAS